jgi:hypothetical protein
VACGHRRPADEQPALVADPVRQRADADGKRPRLVVAAFGEVLPIGEPLPIEDGRYLTFEYLGAAGHLAEAKQGIARERGRFCTSIDTAIRYRRPGGGIEVALIEWKYRMEVQ